MNINKFENKINKYETINLEQSGVLADINSQINDVLKILKNIHITNHKSYISYKKYVKIYIKAIKHLNRTKAIIIHNQYRICQLKISSQAKEKNWSKADCLFNFIQYVEAHQTEDIFPYTQHKIFVLNRSIDRLERKQIKLRYLKDIKLRVKKLANKRVWSLNFRVNHLEHVVKDLNTKINDIKSSFASRYDAKLVAKLIKLKKHDNNPEEKIAYKNNLKKIKLNKKQQIKQIHTEKAQIKKDLNKSLLALNSKKLPKDEYQINKSELYDNYSQHKYELNQQLKLVRYNARNYSNFDNCKYAIELKDVVKYYSNGYLANRVLNNVNLKIKKGEFVVILGPSGSGKTTLLNIISGMDNASYGSSIIAGEELIDYNQSQLTKFRRDNIGYVFQQYGLLPNLTVKENIEIGQNLQSNKAKHIDIDMILDSIGMSAQKNKYPNELSGGQQQRVSIARSVAKNPNILFGDEPTGAIDEEMSKDVMRLFVDVNKKYNTTIVIVTHNPILADLANTVVYVGNGTVKDVVHNKHPKTVDQLNWGNKKK